jgi:hypothetical protein
MIELLVEHLRSTARNPATAILSNDPLDLLDELVQPHDVTLKVAS